MNHMPLRSLASVASVRRPTQRALAKQRTREKILASAKSLFTTRGYEGATIRDIAAAAGMSTGAVFASFTDKSDLFNEIIAADRDALYQAMHGAAQKSTAGGAAVEEVLLALFSVGFEFHLGDLPLLQATLAASWSPQLGRQVRGRLGRRPVTDLIEEALSAAVQRGELRKAANIALLSQMLWDCYLANFRHAAFDAWGAEALKMRLRDQMNVILASSRTG